MRRLDGRIVHLLLTAAGTFDERGTLSRIRGVLIDVTAATQAEAALRASRTMRRHNCWESGRTHWSADHSTR
jgi:hypothetical protein